jgi:hypothetical protein
VGGTGAVLSADVVPTRPDEAGCMATLMHPQPATEHDTRSLGAVVVSGLVLVALLVGAAGVLGAVVDFAGWALAGR